MGFFLEARPVVSCEGTVWGIVSTATRSQTPFCGPPVKTNREDGFVRWFGLRGPYMGGVRLTASEKERSWRLPILTNTSEESKGPY